MTPTPLRYSAATATIRTLASAQHGVVTRAQLVGAGIPPDAVDRRIASKLLRPVHRGVYVTALPLFPPTRALAAVFACGVGSAVSHWSAAILRGFLVGEDLPDAVDVSLARGDRRRPGIRIHRARSLRPNEITMWDKIPMTTPGRTLLDLAATMIERDLERLVVEAFGKRLTTRAELGAVVARHPRHPGTARLRLLLGTEQSALTRSQAERRFLSLVLKAGLPRPEVNGDVEGVEVDVVWHAEKLIVEIDGNAIHSTKGRVANDRRREFRLAAAGYRVIRVRWADLADSPSALLVQLTRALFEPGRN